MATTPATPASRAKENNHSIPVGKIDSQLPFTDTWFLVWALFIPFVVEGNRTNESERGRRGKRQQQKQAILFPSRVINIPYLVQNDIDGNPGSLTEMKT